MGPEEVIREVLEAIKEAVDIRVGEGIQVVVETKQSLFSLQEEVVMEAVEVGQV